MIGKNRSFCTKKMGNSRALKSCTWGGKKIQTCFIRFLKTSFKGKILYYHISCGRKFEPCSYQAKDIKAIPSSLIFLVVNQATGPLQLLY